MTELQILRNALFDEIFRLKRGTADIQETQEIVKVSNAIISTYNTELKAISTLLQAEEAGFETKAITIFQEDNSKNLIDYKAKDV
jgi:hypothetical protein